MKKPNINSVPLTTLILFLICVIVTAALAGTNFITKPRIEALELKAQNEAMAVVLPAESYTASTVTVENVAYPYTVAKNGEKTVGYIITATEKGYGGDVKVMVGADLTGKITAVKIISADDETPGLGQKVTKKDFYEKFSGKPLDDTKIDAITGASISSKAVNNAVEKAADILNKILKGEVK